MKVTTENNVKQYILHTINNVYIGFNDNVEVVLNQITEFDIDLDGANNSTIEFKTDISNIELANYFSNKKNHIIYVRMEATGMNIESQTDVKVYYDVPCNMIIRRLRFDGDNSYCGGMLVELEGFVK